MNTAPQWVRASFGNVKVHINRTPSGVGVNGYPVAQQLLRLDDVRGDFPGNTRYNINVDLLFSNVWKKLKISFTKQLVFCSVRGQKLVSF